MKNNYYITYCAQTKLLNIIEKAEAHGVRISMPSRGGVEFELLFSPPLSDAIMINYTPRVYIDLSSLKRLKKSAIDFNYQTQELIFNQEKNVISTHS